MKKTLTFLLLCLSITASAQFKVIAQSESFDEPSSVYARIIQLKNGNTAFIYIKGNGIELMMYDAVHKMKFTKHLDPVCKEMFRMDGVFESNGDIVVFLNSRAEAATPTLYRLIIDAEAGNIKEQKKIVQAGIDKKTPLVFYYNEGIDSEFFVRRDLATGTYAISSYNRGETDKNKRLQVILFAPDHKEIGKAWFSLGGDHEFVDFIDMAFTGKETVCVAAYIYNKNKSEHTNSGLVFAELHAGAGEFKQYTSNFLKDHIVDGGTVRYNAVTNKLIVMALSKGNTTKNMLGTKITGYTVYMAMVTPGSYELDGVTETFPEKASEKSRELFGAGDKFDGLPQNIFVHQDGSYTVVYEEIQDRVVSDMGGATCVLGHLAIVDHDPQGRETNSYFIPKRQKVGLYGRPFYHAKRQETSQILGMGMQYKSFAYLDAGGKNYILYNDVQENEELIARGKISTIMAVGEIDAFSCKLDGKNMVPRRQIVFGPAGEKQHQMAVFIMGDYNAEQNVYATLRLTIDGRKKSSQIVWLQPK